MAAWGPAAAAPLLRGIRWLPLHCVHRMFASQTEGELKVTQILKEKFPRATAIKVTDISGGCGAMYEIQIESEDFKEKRTVQQHQMVNQAPESFRRKDRAGLLGNNIIGRTLESNPHSQQCYGLPSLSKALKEEIKGMHGLRIFTSVPKH